MRKLLAAEKNGVGLAAPQVGVPIALFIVAGRVFFFEGGPASGGEDEREENQKELKDDAFRSLNSKTSSFNSSNPHPLDKVFINPELIRASRKKAEMSEGCLSVRDIYGTVLRHEKASIKALDENGQPTTYHGAGLLAHIFQHEIDHLNGILFTDIAMKLDKEKKL